MRPQRRDDSHRLMRSTTSVRLAGSGTPTTVMAKLATIRTANATYVHDGSSPPTKAATMTSRNVT